MWEVMGRSKSGDKSAHSEDTEFGMTCFALITHFSQLGGSGAATERLVRAF
jgi:hypothetical protein